MLSYCQHMNATALTPFAMARSKKGLSLAQVSEIVGYDRGGLSRIERGKARPRLALANKLSDVLGISRDQIMFPEEYIQPDGKKPVQSAGEEAV